MLVQIAADAGDFLEAHELLVSVRIPSSDGMKMDRQASKSRNSRDRVTAWLREEAPSLR